ncbi:hypothetical protein D3C80_509360 [compost metagenome]
MRRRGRRLAKQSAEAARRISEALRDTFEINILGAVVPEIVQHMPKACRIRQAACVRGELRARQDDRELVEQRLRHRVRKRIGPAGLVLQRFDQRLDLRKYILGNLPVAPRAIFPICRTPHDVEKIITPGGPIGPKQDVGQVEVVDLLIGVVVLCLDVEKFAAGNEVRFIIQHVPAIAGENDHDLVKVMVMQRKRCLRSSFLHDDRLSVRAEKFLGQKLHRIKLHNRARCYR